MKTRKRKRKVPKPRKATDKATAVWTDIDIYSVQELDRERVKVTFKAHFHDGETGSFITIWRPPRDTLSMFSVVRQAGVPVKKTEKGYEFASHHLVGTSIKECAIKPDKKPGRVRLWHPDERERILKTGQFETPVLV